MLPIRRVQRSDAVAPEQLGSKYKFWFHEGPRRLLFKAEERGTGEDWAEKIADGLADLLGLPHVQYELAELFDGDAYVQPGVVCETCAPPPTALVLANELLPIFDPTYPCGSRNKHKVREHTIAAVAQVVQVLFTPPPQWICHLPPGTSAFQIFVGYIMFDAWIANQDRHDENWGALWSEPLMCLAPTFDHGASLARNLTDAERLERLQTKDRNRTMESFASKARSAFYRAATDSRPLGTIEAFLEFGKRSTDAAHFWTQRLERISDAKIEFILQQIPLSRMSDISRRFSLQLLQMNRQRILESWAKI